MEANLVILLIIFSFIITAVFCQEYCLADDMNPDYNFSSKTPYEYVYGHSLNDNFLPDCQPVQLWSFNRHGTRLPDTKTIISLIKTIPQIRRDIINNYEVKKSYSKNRRLCDKDLENLKQWVWIMDVTADKNAYLAQQGKVDLNNMAIRTRKRFSNLFLNTSYSEENFVFKYTDEERIEGSYRAYIQGFFGEDVASNVNGTLVDSKNPLLGHYTPCTTFQNYVTKIINDPTSEPNKFAKSRIFKNMITDISRKLGFVLNLSQDEVQSMYKMCVYEKALELDKLSPWCAIFTKEQLNILEYYEDLFYYYQSGYGNDLAKHLGCNAVKNLLYYFENLIAKPNGTHPKLIALFTHSPSIRVLYTALNLFKDPYPLTASNYYQAKSRTWRATDMCPFAANLASVLYECPKTNEYKVKFLLNEKDVNYPGYRATWNWEDLYQKLKSVATNCNFNFCNSN